jgi:hypothetical protein
MFDLFSYFEGRSKLQMSENRLFWKVPAPKMDEIRGNFRILNARNLRVV